MNKMIIIACVLPLLTANAFCTDTPLTVSMFGNTLSNSARPANREGEIQLCATRTFGAGASARATSEAEELEKRMFALHDAGRDDEALAVAEEFVRVVEGSDAYSDFAKANANCEMAYGALCVRKPEKALAVVEHALALAPHAPMCHATRAHALLFLGRTKEAQSIYLSHRNERIGKFSWKDFVSLSFRDFRTRGLERPQMAKVEHALARSTNMQTDNGRRRVVDACLRAHQRCKTHCVTSDITDSRPAYLRPTEECIRSCDYYLKNCFDTYVYKKR